MEFLGIGPSELLFIVIIALIVLGPRDMQKAGRTIGRWLRRVVTSDGWKLFQQTSREIQTLPNRLMREAALDELREAQKDLQQPFKINSSPSETGISGTARPSGAAADATPEASESSNKILPPPVPPTAGGNDKDTNE